MQPSSRTILRWFVLAVLMVLIGPFGCAVERQVPTASPPQKLVPHTRAEPPLGSTSGLVLDVSRVIADITVLADDRFAGRHTLTQGAKEAARYIADQHEAAGLVPVESGFLSEFPLVTGATLSSPASLIVRQRAPRGGVTFTREIACPTSTFVPLWPSGSGSSVGSVVFVGYATIGRSYDDLAGVDVKGKIALVLLDAPGVGDTARQAALPFARLSTRSKLERLVEAGAIAIIVVRGPRSFVDTAARKADALPKLEDAGVGLGKALHIPVVQMRWKQAEKLFRVGGASLSSVQEHIDTELRPRSGVVDNVSEVVVTTAIHHTTTSVPNVLAKIPGGELAHELVVLGAHYDHIGVAGQTGHSCPKAGEAEHTDDLICNGADDNASGTAMVLEIARAWQRSNTRPKRTIVFAHFTAEELGLHGSRWVASSATFAHSHVVAMINLDMVGRLGPRGLAIGGVATSPTWMPLLDRVGPHGLEIIYERAIASRSDHASFYQHDIPVLFFFTHTHVDYHRVSDHVDKLNRDGMKQIAELVASVMIELGQGQTVPFAPARPGEGLTDALPGVNSSTIEKHVGKTH